MKLFNSQKFESLDDLLLEQVEDLYDAEQRLCDALPKMADAANNDELAQAFREHLEETRRHVTRLDEVFRLLGKEPTRESCDAMKGLISEGEEMIEAKGDKNVLDAALIAAAQRVEHYEMAGYGSVRAFANQIGRDDVAALFQETLDEEKAADDKLNKIAESIANPRAVKA